MNKNDNDLYTVIKLINEWMFIAKKRKCFNKDAEYTKFLELNAYSFIKDILMENRDIPIFFKLSCMEDLCERASTENPNTSHIFSITGDIVRHIGTLIV